LQAWTEDGSWKNRAPERKHPNRMSSLEKPFCYHQHRCSTEIITDHLANCAAPGVQARTISLPTITPENLKKDIFAPKAAGAVRKLHAVWASGIQNY
jgi:hypothetical protein